MIYKPLLILNLFIFEYLDQILPRKEMKEAFNGSKAPTWEPLFLLKIKLN